MAVEYKFKPYKPKKLKMAKNTTGAQLKNLQKQRDNLNQRLQSEGIDPDTLGGEFDNRNFLEKAFNVTPDQGVLMDFFEVINRPVEAVKAGLMAQLEGRNVLESAWEGLSGEVVTEGSAVLDKIGVDLGDSSGAQFAENILADIVLDPLNLIPAGYFLKKFGSIFMRSKSKLIKQFTGKILRTVNKITVNGEVLDIKNLDELKKFLDNADEDTIKQIQRQLNEIADPPRGKFTGDVYAEGGEVAEETVDQYKYTRTYKDLEMRAQKLAEYRDKIAELEKQFRRGEIATKEELINKINDVLPDSFRQKKAGVFVDGRELKVKSIKESVLTELQLYEDAKQIVKRYGPDYEVVLNKTANRIDDVAIVRKVKVGDKTYYVKALGIEAKKATDFYLKTMTLASVNGKLVLKTDGGATQFSAELQQRFDALMAKKVKGSTTETIGDRINKAFQNDETVKLTDIIKTKKQKAELKELLIDLYLDGGTSGQVYFGGPGQQGFFMDINEAKEYLDISSTYAGKTGGQFRFIGNARLDVSPAARGGMNGIETLISEGRAYDAFLGISNLVEQPANLADVERTARVNIFDFYKDRPGLIGDFSKVGAKFINFMKEKFSAYGFLTAETAANARKLKGETAVQYQTRMLRLAGLRDAFQTQFPNLDDRYLAALVESGATLRNGVIEFADRTVSVTDYLRSFVELTEGGNPGMLRKFARGKERAFVNSLNEIFNKWAGTNNAVYFKVDVKNGVKVLVSEGIDSSEIKKVIQLIEGSGDVGLGVYKGKMLDYGKYNLIENSPLRLPKDAEDILRNWKDKDGNSLYGEFVEMHHDVQRMMVDEGGFTNFLNASGELNDTYLRHTMTKQAYQYMSKNMPGVLSKFAKPGSQFFKARRYLGSIDEVNDYLKAIYNLDMEVFDPSAFRAAEDFFKYAFRNIEQGRLMKLLLESQDNFGEGLLRVINNTQETVKDLSGENIIFKDFREEFPQLVKNLSNKQIAGLQGYLVGAGLGDGNRAIAMNKTIHRVIKEAEKGFKALDDLTKLYDGFLNTWKGLTLVTPGFHLRNLFGNMFNSYVAGMDTVAQLKYTRIAQLELDKFDKAIKLISQGTKFSDLPKNLQAAYENVLQFRKSGLLQSHRGVRDLEQLKEASELGADSAKGVKKLYNDVIRLNFNFAEKMDDTQRYILYRWALDKTGDANKAAKIVADSLFDYSALTGFEKDVMKRLFPFYTFMKNNFIFHAKNILANPKMYARSGRAYKYYLEDIAGYGPDDLPDYMTESMWLPIPMMVTKNDREGVAFLKANLPITDFVELVQNPFEKGVQSVTVPIKLMIEVGAGRDLFTGQPIEKFPGQTNIMESGTGVLSDLRNRRGQLTIAQTPLAQKILNDLGLRTPLQFGTAGLDILDTVMGYQGTQSGFVDFLERAGVVGAQETERLEIAALYQDLEQLRNLKRIYEQETGNQLPVLPRG